MLIGMTRWFFPPHRLLYPTPTSNCVFKEKNLLPVMRSEMGWIAVGKFPDLLHFVLLFYIFHEAALRRTSVSDH